VGAWAPSVVSFPPNFKQASPGPFRALHELKPGIGS
jgi:hypothetical protein